MAARKAAVALLVGAVCVGTTSGAAADDSWGAARPVALSTCDSAACRLLVRVPGHTLAASSGHSGSERTEVPTCLMVPVATPPTKAGPNVGSYTMYQSHRDCFLHGQLVSSQPIYFTVEPDAPPTAHLAQQAYGILVPPRPMVQMSPATGIPQLTGLPTWLFLKPGSWASASGSASAGGVTVTATAVPQAVTWSIGDGGSVTCRGPGTPYPAQADSASAAAGPSPDCGYTYRRTSAGMPGGVFDVTATISWRVDWHGGGNSGSFPDLRSSAHVPVRVGDVSALVTTLHS